MVTQLAGIQLNFVCFIDLFSCYGVADLMLSKTSMWSTICALTLSLRLSLHSSECSMEKNFKRFHHSANHSKKELLKNEINELLDQGIGLDVNEAKRFACIFPLIK